MCGTRLEILLRLHCLVPVIMRLLVLYVHHPQRTHHFSHSDIARHSSSNILLEHFEQEYIQIMP